MNRPFEDHWDRRFILLAQHVAGWSKDPSTKVGCVVVDQDKAVRSMSFNGFPRGIKDDEQRLNNRERKYQYACHAEENAISHAARIGVSLMDCWAFITFPPCTRCARSLIQAGIRGVSYPAGLDVPERWWPEVEAAREMLAEAGVFVRIVTVSD